MPTLLESTSNDACNDACPFSHNLLLFVVNFLIEFELTTIVIISTTLTLHSQSIVSNSLTFVKVSSRDTFSYFTSDTFLKIKRYLDCLLEDTSLFWFKKATVD